MRRRHDSSLKLTKKQHRITTRQFDRGIWITSTFPKNDKHTLAVSVVRTNIRRHTKTRHRRVIKPQRRQ